MKYTLTTSHPKLGFINAFKYESWEFANVAAGVIKTAFADVTCNIRPSI